MQPSASVRKRVSSNGLRKGIVPRAARRCGLLEGMTGGLAADTHHDSGSRARTAIPCLGARTISGYPRRGQPRARRPQGVGRSPRDIPDHVQLTHRRRSHLNLAFTRHGPDMLEYRNVGGWAHLVTAKEQGSPDRTALVRTATVLLRPHVPCARCPTWSAVPPTTFLPAWPAAAADARPLDAAVRPAIPCPSCPCGVSACVLFA